MGQKLQYQWFRDIPRNVTRREYEQLQFRIFGAVVLGFLSAGMAIAAGTGLMTQPSEDLAQIDTMSIAKAVVYQGDRLDLIKLEGYLVADGAPSMPDDPSRQVIRGVLKLSARGSSRSTTGAEDSLRKTLFEWEGAAKSIFLSEGDSRLPLTIDVARLPMVDEANRLSPRLIRQGESVRTSHPVAVEYGEMRFPLPPETWGEVDGIFTDLERRVLPFGQAVVVVASLVSTPQGNHLADPLGDRLQILVGTEADIRQQSQQMQLLFALLCIPVGLASFWVGRSAYRLRQEFIQRSNQ